jgi:hypothetical protein
MKPNINQLSWGSSAHLSMDGWCDGDHAPTNAPSSIGNSVVDESQLG